MNAPPPSDPIWVEDPATSGFFMQTPGSSNLTWIQDPSPSGFFMTLRTGDRAPRLPALEAVPKVAAEVVEEAVEADVEKKTHTHSSSTPTSPATSGKFSGIDAVYISHTGLIQQMKRTGEEPVPTYMVPSLSAQFQHKP
jgi:hypothetical protein